MKALNRGGNDNEILRVYTSGGFPDLLPRDRMRIVVESGRVVFQARY